MLVLGRRIGQAFICDIPDHNGIYDRSISIRCLGFDNGYVKIGIDAPRDIIIVREEISKRHTMSELMAKLLELDPRLHIYQEDFETNKLVDITPSVQKEQEDGLNA